MKVLLGVTGSVAATLTPKLIAALIAAGHQVQIVATNASLYFWRPAEIELPVWLEEDEWPGEAYDKHATIKHIELREWADVLLIAPLTANTLAKMANGICDNLLTSVARAWERNKPMVVAPAMNTKMWEHPLSAEHLNRLNNWYRLTVVNPVAKKLACGEQGVGAMAEIETIVKVLKYT